MKITNFSPFIITPKADEAIKVFEELGFKHVHEKTGIDEDKVTSNTFKDDDGHYITIASAPVPKDISAIRMNVDDFIEAYDYLKSKGFVNATGSDKVEDTGTSKSALMISPSGYAINITQHTK